MQQKNFGQAKSLVARMKKSCKRLGARSVTSVKLLGCRLNDITSQVRKGGLPPPIQK